MAHFKISDVDEKFLHTPQDATLIFAGASGTETRGRSSGLQRRRTIKSSKSSCSAS